ncbi:hypothetical protein ABFS82_04G141500 [Erythranthe guttata]|uniref:BSD domain-containing protein n=1 Tax=Erythranthe guttata TaxID=4155 RepID=A0A022QAU4_ERYGU|nr:PREDICTED: uncharacterized protein LOC105973521 [Erythranthe guttata]EYU23640.1 hypothetical protein MIMGU_mgv1a011755mg [Erythranthe guttata]|eukprot:XP_012854006.1 PREDICTED: uncharacterized protein LOC105973521 [Erythranthe guttata]
MDFWQRARTFAEEAAKKSQELTQGLGSANFSDVVSEASKRSMELAAEASKFSKEFASEALKRADQISAQIPPPAVVLNNLVDAAQKGGNEPVDLEMFGITDELREFVKGITPNTFRDFPLVDDSEVSDIPTLSNVRQDLTQWQEKHAKIVLSTVKEISKLRYQLCPRVMKERKFWRIYFTLVNSHVAPYEKRYTEDVNLKAAENVKDTEVKGISSSVGTEKEDESSKSKNNKSKSSASEQDLDAFLLGDIEDSDDGPDNDKDDLDDEFDNL